MSEPAWGSSSEAYEPRPYPPEKGAPPVEPAEKHVLLGAPGTPPDAAAIRRRATTSLIINLVLALFFLGVLCIPGAVLAAMAMAEKHDPRRAQRLLRWSWGFLAANLLFYILLVITVIVIAVFLIFAATR
jgi:hypothetical protein